MGWGTGFVAAIVIAARGAIRSAARKAPLVIGGFGDTDCNSDYSRRVMKVADQLGLSEFAWTWNTVQDYGGCANALLDGGPSSGPNTAYANGRASGYGRGVRSHYRKLNARRRYR